MINIPATGDMRTATVSQIPLGRDLAPSALRQDRTPRVSRRRGWTAAPFALGLACTLYFALRPRPVPLPINEDIQHMAAFGALMISGGLALGRRVRLRRLLAIALVILGAVIEGLQALPVIHRDADVNDWLADLAGVGLAYVGLALLYTIAKQRPNCVPPLAAPTPSLAEERHTAAAS